MTYLDRPFSVTKNKNRNKFPLLQKNKTFFQKGLDKREEMRYNIKVRKNVYVPLAQPDRVFGYEPKGRGFESLKARQKEAPIAKAMGASFCPCLKFRTPEEFLQAKILHNVRFVFNASYCIVRTFGF